MRKLTRRNLDELAKEMPVIGEIEQRIFVGGGDGSVYNPYTQFEYDCMLYSGSWNGGYVEGWGYVGDDVTCTSTYPNHNPNLGDERYDNMYAGGYHTGFNEGYYAKDNISNTSNLGDFLLGIIRDISSTQGVSEGDYTLIYYDLGYNKGYAAGKAALEQFDATHL